MGKLGRNTEMAGRKAARSTRQFNVMSRGLSGVAKRAMGMGAAFVGAYASIAGAKSAIKTTVSLAKTTLVLSRNLGFSVEQGSRWAAVAASRNIETKAMAQTFGTVSKQVQAAGVEHGKYKSKLDALGNTEKNRVKRQALMSKGAGKVTDMFKKLGISQNELKDQNFDHLLGRVADGLHAMPAGAERTALSMKLLGRGWQTLGPLLRGGSKAMDEQLALADKYGVTLKGKSIKSIEDLIKAQRESEFATMGLQVAIGTQLIPLVTKAVGAFNKFILGFREGTGAGGKFKEQVTQVIDPLKSMAGWIKRNDDVMVPLTASVLAGYAAWKAYMFISKVMAAMRAGLVILTMWRMGTISLTGSQLALNGALWASPLGLVFIALVALAAGFYVAYQKSETFRNIINAVWDALKTGWGWVKNNWPLLLTILTGPFGLAFLVIKGNIDSIVHFLQDRINNIIDVINFAIKAFNKLPFHKDIGLIVHVGGAGGKPDPGARPGPDSGTAGHRARGGAITRPGIYDVGERGRERVYLPTGAIVEPHGGFGGDVVVPVTLVVDGKPFAKTIVRQAIKKKSVS
jgi:hypothetical protein